MADGREAPIYGEDGFFLGVSLIDNVQPDHDSYRNEIFGPVLEVMRVDDVRGRASAGQRQPVRQRDGDLHPRRRRRATVPVRGPGGHGRHQRADPGACRVLQFGGWKDSLFGDLHMYGPEGVQFYTRGKVDHSRWPDPGTSKVDLGFPRTR